MSKTSKLLKQMKQKVPRLSPISDEMVLPNQSGTVIKKEIRHINVSGEPWTSYAKIIIDQNSNDHVIEIDSEATTRSIFNVISPRTTTGSVLLCTDADALTTGRVLNIASNSNDASVRSLAYLKNNHASATGTIVMELVQNAAEKILFIDQNANAQCINIDTEATTSSTINIDDPKNTTGNILDITNADALTTGFIANFHSNSANASNRSIAQFWNKNSSATACNVLHIKQNAARRAVLINQDANGVSLEIDTEATTASGIYFNNPQTTTGSIFRAEHCNSLTTGKILNLVSNTANSSNRQLVYIGNHNASATGATVLNIRQNAAKRAVFIDCNANTNSIQIDQDCNSVSTQWAVSITNDNAGTGAPGGIDMRNFSVDEPLIKAPNDAVTNPGTLTKQIAVDIAGTVYYLYAYTTGT